MVDIKPGEFGSPTSPVRGDRWTDSATGKEYLFNGAIWRESQSSPGARRRRGGLSSTYSRTSTTKLQSQEAVLDAIINDAGGDYTQFADIEQGSNGVMLYRPNPLAGSWPNAARLTSDIELRMAALKIKADKDRALREAAAVGSAVVQIPTSATAKSIMFGIVVGLGTLLVTLRPWDGTAPLWTKVTYTMILGSACALSAWIIIKMFNATSAARAAARITS